MCEPAASADPLDDLLAAIARYHARPRDVHRVQAQLAEDLIRFRSGCDILDLDFAEQAAEFAATDEFDRQGAITPIAWLRHECHMTGTAAGDAVCVGEQAKTLERSISSMTDGRIGFSHLALLARTAEEIQMSGATFDEERLLHQAERHVLNRFRRDCAHARHAADAATFLAGQRDAFEARSLELSQGGENGCVWIKGFLDPVNGATLLAALEPLARPSGADDFRTRRQRYADALGDIAGHTLGTGGTSSDRRHVPHLQVTTTLETLLGLPGAPAGELEGTAPIAAATVQRFACSANVLRVLLGPDSAVIDVGRARRLPSPATRRAVTHRDGGCVWPGCDRPAKWTEPHHVLHWTRDQGSTEMDNLVSLCRRHHWKVHEGGWQVVRVAGNREVLAIPPTPLESPFIRGPSAEVAA
jgi:uncharacterized protein DUF222